MDASEQMKKVLEDLNKTGYYFCPIVRIVCLKDKCELWDDYKNQCSIKSYLAR